MGTTFVTSATRLLPSHCHPDRLLANGLRGDFFLFHLAHGGEMSLFKIHLTSSSLRETSVLHTLSTSMAALQLIASVRLTQNRIYIYFTRGVHIFIQTASRSHSYVIRRARAVKKSWHRLHFRVWRNSQRAPRRMFCWRRGTFLLFRPLIISSL